MPLLMTRRHFLIVAVGLAIASASALVLIASANVIPSLIRDPISDFVQPGVTVWWFVLGGPFRVAPSSPSGISFAAMANAVFWLGALWLVVALRLVQRWRAALHQ
jgi:hypothetical protein